MAVTWNDYFVPSSIFHPKFLGDSDRDREISSTVDQQIKMRERNMVKVFPIEALHVSDYISP
jgi:hypothetical protein